MNIKRLKTSQDDYQAQMDALLAWEGVSDDQVNSTVKDVIKNIRQRGDEALVEYTNKFQNRTASFGQLTADADEKVIGKMFGQAKPFENWSMIDARMIRTFTLVVDHMADTEAMRQKFLEFASADADVIEENEIKMLTLEHTADGIHCRFYAMAPDPTTAWARGRPPREENVLRQWISPVVELFVS